MKKKAKKVEELFAKDEIEPIDGVDLTGKTVVISAKCLRVPMRRDSVWKATGGFGCKPFTRGTALFCESVCHPGVSVRWERYDVLGILKEGVKI